MQFGKSTIQFKTLTKLLTALLGRKRCHVVQAEFRRCRTSFLWQTHGESKQAVLVLVLVKVLSKDSAVVLYRVPSLSRANEGPLQLMISAAFCQLPGSKQVGGGATSSQFSWPFFLISGHVCLPTAETVLYSLFSVFQELHDWSVCRTIALCLDIYSSSEPVMHSGVLGLNTYLINEEILGAVRIEFSSLTLEGFYKRALNVEAVSTHVSSAIVADVPFLTQAKRRWVLTVFLTADLCQEALLII